MKFYPITPVAKPRMTQSDKWKKRPIVQRYWEFKSLIHYYKVELPEFYHVVFFIETPKSWPKKKKDKMRFQPHKQTPDKDNLEKGLLDALYGNDAHVWTGECSKLWADTAGMVIIEKVFNWGLIEQAKQIFQINSADNH